VNSGTAIATVAGGTGLVIRDATTTGRAAHIVHRHVLDELLHRRHRGQQLRQRRLFALQLREDRCRQQLVDGGRRLGRLGIEVGDLCRTRG
jgi:hypothetical protein